jgi:succinate dehydrogenase/fumarate reductase flavoprotein subunit
MSDPVTLAIELAEAQCSPAQIAAALVRRENVSREYAVGLVQRLADDLADAQLDAQAHALQRILGMQRGEICQRGEKALFEWLVQYCGWSREGVDQQARKANGEAVRDRFKSVKLRAVGG